MRTRKGLHQLVLFISLFLIVLFSSAKSYSADTNAVAYFPMKVGNVYVFEYRNFISNEIRRLKSVIMRDSVFSNGHRYFSFSNYPLFNNGLWYRVDSITGSIYRHDPSAGCSLYDHEIFFDSLAALPGNAIYNCNVSAERSCQAITTMPFFTGEVLRKRFNYYHSNPPPAGYESNSTYYAKGFGLHMFDFIGMGHFTPFQYRYTILGCVFGGIVYGDTVMYPVGIIPLTSSVPDKFSLSQNFPNPFNPTTNINFDIPKNSFVKLKIYDVSGKELTSLVNENLNAGSYNYQWDASSFTSGVYFYRIETNDFIETKRMILLK